MNAPKQLQAYIESRGLTVKEAATELSVPQSALFYWLRGASVPRAATRVRIAKWTGGRVPAPSWLDEPVPVRKGSTKRGERAA